MIISKTPFRLSLFGGGTDLPSYLNRSSRGMCIGFALDKFCYIFFRNSHYNLDYKYRISYSKIELKKSIEKVNHPSVRHTAKFFKYSSPFDLGYHGDLPARSGLGSSSSFTVGMCNIFRYVLKKKITPLNLAKDAIHIEQKLINEKVGFQDQIFAAYGGLNSIEFKKKSFTVNKIRINNYNKSLLEDSIVLVHTNQTRIASNIEKNKSFNIESKLKYYEEILKCADEFKSDLKNNKIDIKKTGEMLDFTWNRKKKLSNLVTNQSINELYNYFKSNGAYGGKLMGAGGGGFMMFILNRKNKNKILKKIKNISVACRIFDKGSTIIAMD